MEKKLIQTMATLNAVAAKAMNKYRVHVCTDVTGFGLLGHLKEMTAGSGVEAEIVAGDVPTLDLLEEMVASGAVPGGTENNLAYLDGWVNWSQQISNTTKLILCDAQTSGGLLLSIHADDAVTLLKKLKSAGTTDAVVIGRMVQKGKGLISVV